MKSTMLGIGEKMNLPQEGRSVPPPILQRVSILEGELGSLKQDLQKVCVDVNDGLKRLEQIVGV